MNRGQKDEFKYVKKQIQDVDLRTEEKLSEAYFYFKLSLHA